MALMPCPTMDTHSWKPHCLREKFNETTSIKEEENVDDMDASFAFSYPSSQAVIKQEKDENSLTHEAHASVNILPNILHSPMLIKKESRTVMLNYTCQMKQESQNKNEQSWEEEMSVNDPLGTAIKQEITDMHTMDHQGNQPKTSECDDNGEEMNKHESGLHYINSVILKNDKICEKVPDTVADENEDMSYTTAIEVDQQQLSHLDDDCHTCRFCGRNFKSLDLLNKHMICHPNDYACTYACDHCEKAFKSRDNLNRHKARQQSNENLYSCDICGKTFAWHCQFKSHKEICQHSKERPYVCDICGKDFKLKDNLREHKEFHSNETPYACNICNKTYKIKRRLQRHIASSHASEKPFSCDMCGKAYKWASLLNNHKKYGHSDEKRYSCDVCGKAFKQRGCLNRHVVIHTDEWPYSCDECGKGFKQRSALDLHKASVHLNERPYACDVCGKAFKQRKALTQHQASIHLNEAPYLCCVCGKAFKNNSARDKHEEVIHQKKNPHVCDVCGKSFKMQAYLIRHKETHKG